MGIMAGIALPRLNGSTRSHRLDEGAQFLSEYIRHARVAAVKQQLKVKLEFSLDGQSYWLSLQDRTSQHTEQYSTFGDSFLDSPRHLPGGVRLLRIPALEQSSDDKSNRLIFSPSGYDEPIEIRLADKRGRTAAITLGALYDEVHVRLETEAESLLSGGLAVE
jgi:Tfp pilus assembly protein FimT